MWRRYGGVYLSQKAWNEKGWHSGPGCLFAVFCGIVFFAGIFLLANGAYFWGTIFSLSAGWSLYAGIRNARKRRK